MAAVVARFAGSLLHSIEVVAFAALPLQSQAPERYVVTASPINVGVASGRLCIAVDPVDRQGVWWEPGRSGCSSRSTGPGVFHAQQAEVSSPSPSGAIEISFRMPLHSTASPFADVRLVLERGGIRAAASGARVPTERRKDLNVPESP